MCLVGPKEDAPLTMGDFSFPLDYIHKNPGLINQTDLPNDAD